MEDFRPNSTHARDIRVMLGILVSVINGQKAIYMSAPITSGRRILEIKSNTISLDDSLGVKPARGIIESNRAHAQNVKRKLRSLLDGIIVDPTLVLDIDGWTQDDYRFFWGKVIENYAKTVIFIDGWNYSNGCTYEFLIANMSNVEVLDERLLPIPVSDGISKINRAIGEFRESKAETDFLEKVVATLTAIK